MSGDEIYSWASQLASESRNLDWITKWYVWPETVFRTVKRLRGMNGGIIALVGVQGVGKTSALLAIVAGRMLLELAQSRTSKSEKPLAKETDYVSFKWRRQPELMPSLIRRTHEASPEFYHEYSHALLTQLNMTVPFIVPEELQKNPEQISQDWAAKFLGKHAIRELRLVSWLNMLLKKKLILIDMPDYSKTDRRLMAKDLNEIYWLWNLLCKAKPFEDNTRPNIVVTIQKEMLHDHFFFDKMEKIELEPLKPEQMLEAYRARFKTTEPFTEDALLTLARMSRGIFRHFLRYITLTLQHREPDKKQPIDVAAVKETVTIEKLAEDMELELAELFPKQSDLRYQAVRLMMHLEESGPRKQTELAEELGIEAYAMSRLLTKLELHRYITRQREETDKLVSLNAHSFKETIPR